MNARSAIPPASRTLARSQPRRVRSDQEFLPAALEILETPPSPVGIWLLWIICILAVASLSWAYLGRLDVVAVAQGKIQPSGRVKVIQPLETGRISSVAVENGQHVAKGETLVRFDSREADADVIQISTNLHAYRAEAARRRAALAALADRVIEPIPTIEWPDGIPASIQAREAQVLIGDLGKLSTTIAGLEAQIHQKERERERFIATIASIDDLVATLQARVDMRSSLTLSGSGSKADLIDATQVLQEQKTSLITARGQLAETTAAIEVLKRSIEEAYRSFLADNLQKLTEAERTVDEQEQTLAKVKLRQERSTLSSPIEGTVSALSITTVGQVVPAGEEVMRIVPTALRAGAADGKVNDGRGIEVEAYLPNRDIGFVHPGQTAIVKVETLPFTRYGTVEATLVRVASDAIPELDATQREGNPAQGGRDRGFAGAQRTQNLVFPATFRLHQSSIVADGVAVPLSPGMAVTVEIRTGSRSILEYLFSPLVEVTGSAMKER